MHLSLMLHDDSEFELSHGPDDLKLKGLNGVALLSVEREAAVVKSKSPESLSCFRGFCFHGGEGGIRTHVEAINP